MRKHIKTIALTAVVAGALTAGAVLAISPGGGGSGDGPTASSTPAAAQLLTGSNNNTAALSGCLSASDVYQSVRPAVVEINTTTQQRRLGGSTEASGSGIIISDDGTILTNNHVVAGASQLEVKFSDGSTTSAKVLGTDPGDDLAVIRADLSSGQQVTVASLGNSDSVQPGDPVLAIGNPLGYEGTITEGIVSATGRTFASGQGTRPIRNMIQTDASVNPGNSGGPLLDCQGKVIGINSALENPTGQNFNIGIAFAVPINTANRFLPDMKDGKAISHPWLGIAGEDLTSTVASQVNVSAKSGVYVTLVSSGSPAEHAGLRGAFQSADEAAASSSLRSGGDVILKVDGKDVSSVDQVASYLDQKKVGDSVTLTILRDGQQTTVNATLAEWPS